jgi:hypothetical protein
VKCGDEVRKGIKMVFVRFTQGAPDHKSNPERASDRAALGGSAVHRVSLLKKGPRQRPTARISTMPRSAPKKIPTQTFT